MADGWSHKFSEPIELPDGITWLAKSVPASEHNDHEVQVAGCDLSRTKLRSFDGSGENHPASPCGLRRTNGSTWTVFGFWAGRLLVMRRSRIVGNGSLPPAAFHSATNAASSVRIAISRNAASVLSRSRLIWSRMESSTRTISARKWFISRLALLKTRR